MEPFTISQTFTSVYGNGKIYYLFIKVVHSSRLVNILKYDLRELNKSILATWCHRHNVYKIMISIIHIFNVKVLGSEFIFVPP